MRADALLATAIDRSLAHVAPCVQLSLDLGVPLVQMLHNEFLEAVIRQEAERR